jgi:hypothetical protein
MGRSSLEWLCFFIAAAQRGASSAAHLRISHATDIFFGLCPLIEELCSMRATRDSFVPRLPYRWFAGAELSARICKSQRVRTSDGIFALAKSRRRQVRHGAWKSGEA